MGNPQVRLPRWLVALAAFVLAAGIGTAAWSLRAFGTAPASPADAVPTPPITTAASGRPDDPVGSAVQVRVRNHLGFDASGVKVTFPDGRTVDYGPVAAGAASRYAEAGRTVYRYARVQVSTAPGPPADGRVFTLQPIDFVGEEPLDPGRYTYVLSLVDDQLVLTLR